MKTRKTFCNSLIIGFLIAACLTVGCDDTAPFYRVTQSAPTPEQAKALAEALKIDADVVTENRSIGYSSDQFLAVPTIDKGLDQGENEEGESIALHAFDIDEINKIKVVEGKVAIDRFLSALKKAGLNVENKVISAEVSAANSELTAVDQRGEPLFNQESVPIDTHVNFSLALQGVPLIGPGAKVKAVFAPNGQVTNLRHTLRQVEPAGEVKIFSSDEATAQCKALYEDGKGDLQVSNRLVYYAPSLDHANVRFIYPHYECSGFSVVNDEKVPLRKTLIPAMRDRAELKLEVDITDNGVAAKALIKGGTAPYTYLWGSSSSTQNFPNQPKIFFTPDNASKKAPETISVTVIDADGLAYHASEVIMNAIFVSQQVRLMVAGENDVGAEWIGSCGGLSGSSSNAGGFISTFGSNGWNPRFNWGNYLAWERDFIDPTVRSDGIDDDYVDNVDFVFYTGHANGNSFSFCGNNADTSLHYIDDPKWGNNNDIEWLVVAACGPLQLEAGGKTWWQRWGRVFHRLHLFMGYQTVTYDNTVEGTKLANYTLDSKTVKSSWAQTAIDVQSSNETWAVMGVISDEGFVNYNDHIWGKGSVGPDIFRNQITGYWMVYGPS